MKNPLRRFTIKHYAATAACLAAVIAVMAGLRAGICRIAEPREMRSVRDPTQASTLTASEPHASAAYTE